jgi:hypothetical protein
MSYLYGDSTPFPFDENYLETLVDLTEAVVAILRIDEATAQTQQRSQHVISSAEKDVRWLSELGKLAATTITERLEGAPSPYSSREAARLLRATKGIVEEGRQHLLNRRDASLRELESSKARQRSQLEPVLEQLLLARELPGSEWGLSWRVLADRTPSVVSEALVMASCGIEATFRLDIPQSHPWSQPVRVGDLSQGLCVQIDSKGSIFGNRTRRKKVNLSRLFVCAVDLSSERCALTLKRRPQDQDPAYEIIATDVALTIQPGEGIGTMEGTVYLEGTEAEQARCLVDAVRKALRPLVRHRVVMTDFALNDKPLGELADLGGLARVLIASVAPYVQEIVRRSPTACELSLKRDIGERKREELFVPVAELTFLIVSLPSHKRSFFDAFGLPPPSSGSASEEADPDKIVDAVLAAAS